MTILDEYRSFGIGSKLVDEFFKWCKQNSVERVKVTASSQNVRGIGFYKRIGFEPYDITLETKLK